MNCKAKGARAERRARKMLELAGYGLVVRSGASLGPFDLIAIGVDRSCVLLIQIKTNRKPAKAELDRIQAFQCPAYARKQLWLFKDRVKQPEIIEL